MIFMIYNIVDRMNIMFENLICNVIDIYSIIAGVHYRRS